MRKKFVRASLACLLSVTTTTIVARAEEAIPTETGVPVKKPADVLSPDQWKRADKATGRALDWLKAKQRRDGSFPSIDAGQPGVTALCVMAFLAHGHVPGVEPYALPIERASKYVISCQQASGLISLVGPTGPRLSRQVPDSIGDVACYNHAIASLMLSELYGMRQPRTAEPMRAVITKSIAATIEMQRWPKDRDADRGGWRYLNDSNEIDSDLSITGWQLMFLRSARNAGFAVPSEPIDDAVKYVKRCFDQRHGVFTYSVDRPESRSRAMAGAGILALAHAGFHNAEEATRSGNWLLQNNFDDYNPSNAYSRSWQDDRYHYGLFNSCQAMYQLGGRYWEEFYPRAVATLLTNQQPDGSWPAEQYKRDGRFGNCYTTALAVLSLGAPNQFLPVFQR
jgi:hypothetical protein